MRDPDTIGEYFAAELAQGAGCSEVLAVPPSKDCPGYVHWAYQLAGWHILTVALGVFMVAALIQFTFQAIKD